MSEAGITEGLEFTKDGMPFVRIDKGAFGYGLDLSKNGMPWLGFRTTSGGNNFSVIFALSTTVTAQKTGGGSGLDTATLDYSKDGMPFVKVDKKEYCLTLDGSKNGMAWTSANAGTTEPPGISYSQNCGLVLQIAAAIPTLLYVYNRSLSETLGIAATLPTLGQVLTLNLPTNLALTSSVKRGMDKKLNGLLGFTAVASAAISNKNVGLFEELALTTSVTTAGGGHYSESLSDSFALTTTISNLLKNLSTSVSESFNFSATASRLQNKNVSLSNALLVAASLLFTGSESRNFAETLGLVVTLGRIRGVPSAVTDALALGATVTTVKGVRVNIGETLHLVIGASTGQVGALEVDFALDAGVIARAAHFVSLSDSLGLSTTINRGLSYVGYLTAALAITAQTDRLSTLSRLLDVDLKLAGKIKNLKNWNGSSRRRRHYFRWPRMWR